MMPIPATGKGDAMKCPKCKTAPLHKSFYHAPYVCDGCGGIWLHRPPGPELLGMEKASPDPAGARGGNDQKTGICPAGHGIMIRAKVDVEPSFYLERCPTCGGIWFDRGELSRLVAHDLADHLDLIWTKAWQKKQSREKNRAGFLKANRTLLGDPLFEAVMALASQLREHPHRSRAMALLQHEILLQRVEQDPGRG